MKYILSVLLLCSSALTMPTFAQSYEELGDRAMTAIEQDSLDQAEAYILQALKLEPANPHNALLFSNLGTIRRQRQQYEGALEAYSFALNFAPTSVPILMNRATLLQEMGELDAARVDYSMILDFDATNRKALQMRAYIYMQMQAYKEARTDFEKLLQTDEQHYAGRLGLATLSRKEGKLQEALDILNKMITENDKGQPDAVLLVARAGVEMDLKCDDLALADLETAIKCNPSLPEAYLVRGQLLLSQDKKALARAEFEKAASLGIPYAELKELIQQCQ
ncbi:MAG: tetratricopeptide repeat protein [Bacteroides sp.]|nr:tetratricopeptide repeat protein [Bacteroides sp.]